MGFLYETHLHSSEASACARSAGRDYIQKYIDRGYTGIIVTNHFFRGNTSVERGLPWREWVNQFCAGYEDAWEEGDRRGLQVFFGWEECFSGDEYLVYGLDKAWLLNHPEAKQWTRREQYEAVSEAGGCVVQAHPFRDVPYLSEIYLSVGCTHGAEVGNACNRSPEFDALAYRYAERAGLTMTAGSDIHVEPQEITYGVYMDEKIESIRDFAKAVRGNRLAGLHMPEDRCRWTGEEQVRLPVTVIGADGQPSGQDYRKLVF